MFADRVKFLFKDVVAFFLLIHFFILDVPCIVSQFLSIFKWSQSVSCICCLERPTASERAIMKLTLINMDMKIAIIMISVIKLNQ